MQTVADAEFEIETDFPVSEADIRRGLTAAHAFFDGENYNRFDAFHGLCTAEYMDDEGYLEAVNTDPIQAEMIGNWHDCERAVVAAVLAGRDKPKGGSFTLRTQGEPTYMRGDPWERAEAQ